MKYSFEQLVTYCNDESHRDHVKRTGRPFIISLDGNIGAGKTTLLSQLQTRIDPKRVVIVPEPVDVWTQLKDLGDGMSILEKFYRWPMLYSFAFQVTVFHTVIRSMDDAIEANPECEVLVCERSVATSRDVFMKMLLADRKITVFENLLYQQMFSPRIEQQYFPNIIVFLDVPPRICFERMIQRQRTDETTVTVDYLERLDTVYRDWLGSNIIKVDNL